MCMMREGVLHSNDCHTFLSMELSVPRILILGNVLLFLFVELYIIPVYGSFTYS